MAALSRQEGGAIILRPMTPGDIPFGLKLSLAAGWNQTAADWALFLEQSTGGSFIARYRGREAGTVTTVSYQNRLHWIGMVLVAEEFRRLGIGTILLEAAIAAVQGQGAVCLDATPAGKKLYDRLGFRDVVPLSRWLRQSGGAVPRPAPLCKPLTEAMLPAAAEYDRQIFGADRTAILGVLARRAAPLAYAAEHAGRLSGYCLGRYGSHSTQIGPVAADSLECARDLFLAALQPCAQERVIVDIPLHQHQPDWIHFIRGLGFVEQRPFMRMSLGNFTLAEQHTKQLAIAGPEIG
jgi:GNAT superfamily N-acetyltransferase